MNGGGTQTALYFECGQNRFFSIIGDSEKSAAQKEKRITSKMTQKKVLITNKKTQKKMLIKGKETQKIVLTKGQESQKKVLTLIIYK